MARRILNRKDLRADFEAAERRKDEEETEDEEEDDVDEEEGDEDEEAGEEEEPSDEEDEEEVVVPKKKKAKAEKPKTRTRTAKVVRMRVVWGVFDNSNRCIATYEYPRKNEAEAHAARMTSEKPNNPHFIQPVKEPMEEKKEKEK